MARSLSLEWFKGTPPERKEGLEQTIRNSTVALGRLYEILSEWENELTKQECNVSDYADPNWSHRTAHRNGDRSRIRKLKDLLSFMHKV